MAKAKEARPHRMQLAFPSKSENDAPTKSIGAREAFWASSPIGKKHNLHCDRMLRAIDGLRFFPDIALAERKPPTRTYVRKTYMGEQNITFGRAMNLARNVSKAITVSRALEDRVLNGIKIEVWAAGQPSYLDDESAIRATDADFKWGVLKRSPVMLPIPGTSKVKHLEENVAAANIKLSDEDFAALDRQGKQQAIAAVS